MERVALGQIFLQELWSPPISIITPMPCTHSPIYDGLYICLPQQLLVSLATCLNITVPSKSPYRLWGSPVSSSVGTGVLSRG